MKIITTLLMLAGCLAVNAAPATDIIAKGTADSISINNNKINIPEIPNLDNPITHMTANDNNIEIPYIPNLDHPDVSIRNTPRADEPLLTESCGQYKFPDGAPQEFTSQKQEGLLLLVPICRRFWYFHGSAMPLPGIMAAARVYLGCTCYFYT